MNFFSNLNEMFVAVAGVVAADVVGDAFDAAENGADFGERSVGYGADCSFDSRRYFVCSVD